MELDVIIEIKYTVNVTHLNYLNTLRPAGEKAVFHKVGPPQNQSLVPKMLGTAGLDYKKDQGSRLSWSSTLFLMLKRTSKYVLYLSEEFLQILHIRTFTTGTSNFVTKNTTVYDAGKFMQIQKIFNRS